jgi:hypothetical protein
VLGSCVFVVYSYVYVYVYVSANARARDHVTRLPRQATGCELEVQGLKECHGFPLSLHLDNLTIHNHSSNPPLGLCISSAAAAGPLSHIGGAGPGKGGVSERELRHIEETVVGQLELLEQHLSFGALATLQAVDRDPRGKGGGGGGGGHDAAMVLQALGQQLHEHAAQMQRARLGIARAFRPADSLLASAGAESPDRPERGAGRAVGEGSLQESASSLARTRGMLEQLMVEVLGTGADDDAVQALLASAGSLPTGRHGGGVGGGEAGRELLEDDLLYDQIDAEEMLEIFEAFCEEEEEEEDALLASRA